MGTYVCQSAQGGEKEEGEEGNRVGKPVRAWHRHRKNPDGDVDKHNLMHACALLCNASVLGTCTYARYTEPTGDDCVIEHYSIR